METLIKSPLCCDLIVTANLEAKIRKLCSIISTIEWSGTLFYKVEGNAESGLIIKCIDLYLMDIGNATYTEFDLNPDILSYMMDNDLLGEDVYHGLTHSHNTFSAFFSGTDLNTLKEFGSKQNHFVSLIVNNEGTYCAAVTRKINCIDSIKTNYSYNSWNNNVFSGNYENTSEYSTLEYINANIIKEDPSNINTTELENRIQEVKAIKDKQKEERKLLFPKLPNIDSYTVKYTPKDIDDVKLDHYTLMAFKQCICCSMLVTYNPRFSPTEWANNMENLYSDRFINVLFFTEFAEAFLENLFNIYEEKGVDTFTLASKLIDLFSKLPVNRWIEAWIQALQIYVSFNEDFSYDDCFINKE